MTEIKEVLVINHTHTDVGYTHPQPVYWELSRRFIDEALDYCDATADWPEGSRLVWTCEVTSAVVDWLKHRPSKQIDRFRAAAERGQLAIGAMFCNMTPLYNLEELAQSLLPVKMLREDFGLPITVAINHDVNGLPWTVVPLLRDAGIDGLLMGINIHFGAFPLHRPLGFNWRGPDGRTLLTFNGEHYQKFDALLNLQAEDPTTAKMAEGMEQYLSKLAAANYAYDFVYLTSTHPHFCDNNPPSPNFARTVRQWNAEERTPRIRIVTPETVIARLAEQPSATVPTHGGDWTDYWNFGSGSAALEMTVSRAARRRLYATQALATAHPFDDDSEQRAEEARWNLQLYDEHTWGSFCGILSKLPTLYHDMWTFKAAYGYTASCLSAMLIRDRLDAVAGNPTQGQGIQSYLLYNPGPEDRTLCFTTDKHFAAGTFNHLCSTIHRLDTEFKLRADECHIYGIDAVTVGPFEVPAHSYIFVDPTSFNLAELAPQSIAGEDFVESPHHRLRFDPQTGRITELLDKATGQQLIDVESKYDFFGLVRETIAELNERAIKLNDPRETFFSSDWEAIHKNQTCWIADWKAHRVQPTELLSIETERTPEGVRLRRRFKVDGADDFLQTITLLEYEPTVQLEAFFKKEDVREPEGFYFAFPLAIENWRAHFDTAGTATEFDAEQLPGCCRDWVTADSYLALHNDEVNVTIACPDAPLFQLGDFNFGKHQQSVPGRERGLVLGWAMNNYWHTNFRPSQPGYVRIRYELRASTSFDPCASATFGRSAATPVELHPVVSESANAARCLVKIEGEGVTLEHLKPGESGGGVISRLVNHRDKEIIAKLSLPGRPIAEAWVCTTLEEPVSALQVEDDVVLIPIGARALRTVRCRTES